MQSGNDRFDSYIPSSLHLYGRERLDRDLRGGDRLFSHQLHMMENGGSHKTGHQAHRRREARIGELELLGGVVFEALAEFFFELRQKKRPQLFRGEVHFSCVEKNRGVAELGVRERRKSHGGGELLEVENVIRGFEDPAEVGELSTHYRGVDREDGETEFIDCGLDRVGLEAITSRRHDSNAVLE